MDKKIVKRFDKINDKKSIETFFVLLKKLIGELNINGEDPRLSTNVRNDNRKRISVCINGLLVLSLKEDSQIPRIQFMIHKSELESFKTILIDTHHFDTADGKYCLVDVHYNLDSEELNPLLSVWIEACKEYLPTQERSQYRKNHLPELFQMANDEALIKKYLENEQFIYACFGSYKTISEDYESYQNKIEQDGNCAVAWSHRLKDNLEFYEKNKPFRFYLYENDHQPLRYAYVVEDFQTTGDTNGMPCPSEWEKYLLNPEDKGKTTTDGYIRQTWLLISDVELLGSPIEYDRIKPTKESSLNPGKLRSAVASIYDPQNDEINSSTRNTSNNMEIRSLNTILYGPPGTGKTYNTIDLAVQVAAEEAYSPNDHKANKKKFDGLINDGRIVFTTFHQNMSYEDFVEGLKPKTEKGSITYEVEDGIFKQIINKANPASGNFDDILESFKRDISEPDGKSPLTIESKSTNFDVVYRGTNVFYIQPHFSTKENPWYPVNIANIRKVYETDDYKGVYNPTYVREILSFLEKNKGLGKQSTEAKEKSPFILIIDEINRGNVSQIFGELITLIEDDKRSGKPNAIEVTLPYSKDKFTVPPNLYIIGTMNTADRSVEALDVALRRRFQFINMPPDPDLLIDAEKKPIEIEGIVLKDLLKLINERITFLKDEDHQIGHSYLMNVSTADGLRETFAKNIIPLLKEYFYNDFEKILLVLGSGFVESMKKPSFPVSGVDVFDEGRFKLKVINSDFGIIQALKQTLETR